MKHGDQYIEPDNSYYRPSRDPNEGTMTLVVVITLLFVCLTGVLAAVYFKKDHTHTSKLGAQMNAQSFAKGLKANKSELAKYLKK